jgi:hypothetical protein
MARLDRIRLPGDPRLTPALFLQDLSLIFTV